MPSATKRYMGQNFLISEAVATAESAHSIGKTVLEIGPGRGMLTKGLCKHAKRVIAVEKDARLFTALKSVLQYRNLKLINKDFFEATESELELSKIDIVIANVPYSMSSKIVMWLREHNIPAVLCLQKEFVEHMLAGEGTRNYSRLSVTCALSFRITEIMKVPRSSFRPVPGVDSEVIFIKPKNTAITPKEDSIINMLMQHKKKMLRNAILDSGINVTLYGGILPEETLQTRVFKMSPERLLAVAKSLHTFQKP